MILEVRDLTKSYGNKAALNHLTASFTPGIYGIVGNNGAGKTTFMNLLTDNLKRDSGEIRFDGKEILELGADYRERIGYMPQYACCYGAFTARKFLQYMGQLKGIKRKDIWQEVESVLRVIRLEKHANKRIDQLSGGCVSG